VTAVFQYLRQLYREGIRPHLISQTLQLRKIYVGPNRASINFYEKVGRAVCGTVYGLLILLYVAFWAGAMIIPWWWLVHGIIWISHHYRD
jgi:hypothetical protein